MKKTFLLFVLFFVLSCKNSTQENNTTVSEKIEVSLETGQQLFESNNCIACHQLNKKMLGPSIADIAKIYKEKKGNLIGFLKGEAPAIVDPSQYASMQVNLEITKNMSTDELKALELYILNQYK
jgi:cytochrome c